MNLIVHPGAKLTGESQVPGDKSISHRAALFAGLAEGTSQATHFLVSGVTYTMLNALSSLGVLWELDGEALVVSGVGLDGIGPPVQPVDCDSSATTLRLLAGAIAAAGIPAVLDGSDGLRRRPMGRIVEPLRAMGVLIDPSPDGGAPLLLAGRAVGTRLRAVDHHLPVASAQVKSCLLLAALAADGPVTITEPALSRDHSECMLGSIGVGIERMAVDGRPGVRVTPLPEGTNLKPLDISIPGDFSAAAFLMTAALITPGSDIVLRGVGLNPTRTGLLETLNEMGADLIVFNRRSESGEQVGDLGVRASELRGVTVSGERVVQMIDEFPVFGVAAAYAQGRTVVRQAEELRYKESDRITALVERLKALGVQAEETPDGFVVDGAGKVPGGCRVDSQGDHRLAMAMAVAGLGAGRLVEIEDAEILSQSFPQFPQALRSLGADIVEMGEDD